MMEVKPIPDGLHSVTPYLIVEGVPGLIDFLKAAFEAKEIHRTELPDGQVMHAQLQIGGHDGRGHGKHLMMGEAMESFPAKPASLYLYVHDADAVYKQALEAGAESLMEPADQFYGDRNAGVKDPTGNTWWIGTHVEDVGQEEVVRRAAAMGRG